MTLKSFGRRVREKRKEKGYNQDELAEKVDISRTYLSQIEQGKARNLSLQLATKLGETLGLESPYPPESSLEEESIPDSLWEFADQDDIPPRDVKMLAEIEYRGSQPQRPDQWRTLYNVIKNTSGE